MSNSFSTTFDWHLAIFFIAAGLLSLTLCIQYVLVYFQSEKKIDKQITRAFAGILIFRTVTLFLVGFFIKAELECGLLLLVLLSVGLRLALPENIKASSHHLFALARMAYGINYRDVW